MGTNYYHRTNICSCCDRYDETHICKSMTTFEAVIVWGGKYGCDRSVVVGSWADWKERLRTVPGVVFDEYGDEHPIEFFIDSVESIDIEERRRHRDWMLVNGYEDRCVDTPTPDGEWIDEDGYSFSGREFS